MRPVRRAFTLFEVAVAVTVTSIAVIAVIMILLSATRVQQKKRYELFAAAMAVDIVDKFCNTPTAFFSMRGEGRELVDVTLDRRAHQVDIETAILTNNANIHPLPTAIARRFDDEAGEIAQVLDAGGRLYYFGSRVEAGMYDSHDARDDRENAAARVVFAVRGFAQQNALSNHPLISWPYYHQVPSPPILQHLQEQSHSDDLFSADGWPALWDGQVFRDTTPEIEDAFKQVAKALVREKAYDVQYHGIVPDGGRRVRNMERPDPPDKDARVDDKDQREPMWEDYDRPLGVIPEEYWDSSDGGATWQRRQAWPPAIDAIRNWDAVLALLNAVCGTTWDDAADVAAAAVDPASAIAIPDYLGADAAPKAVALGYLAFVAASNQRMSPGHFDDFEASTDPDKFEIHRDDDATGGHWDYTPAQVEIERYHISADELRAIHELALRWHLQWQVQRPRDLRVSRPMNRPLMLDVPLLQYDLLGGAVGDGGSGLGFHPAGLPDGASSTPRRWRSWRVIGPVASSLDPTAAAAHELLLPRRNLSGTVVDYWHNQFDYGDYQIPDPSTWQGDPTRFALDDPFAAAERCRQLVFWAVDWQAYEDFESAPSDPYDASRSPVVPRRGATQWHQFDFVNAMTGSVGGGGMIVRQTTHLAHNRSQNPEWEILWNTPQRRDRQPPRYKTYESKDVPWTRSTETEHDHWRELGRYGADRNGNGRLDRGPLPTTKRLRAEVVGRYNLYDRRLPGAIRQ